MKLLKTGPKNNDRKTGYVADRKAARRAGAFTRFHIMPYQMWQREKGIHNREDYNEGENMRRSRGDTEIPKWEIRVMMYELVTAKTLIDRGFREQHNKDVVIGHINCEIQELKEIYNEQ